MSLTTIKSLLHTLPQPSPDFCRDINLLKNWYWVHLLMNDRDEAEVQYLSELIHHLEYVDMNSFSCQASLDKEADISRCLFFRDDVHYLALGTCSLFLPSILGGKSLACFTHDTQFGTGLYCCSNFLTRPQKIDFLRRPMSIATTKAKPNKLLSSAVR